MWHHLVIVDMHFIIIAVQLAFRAGKTGVTRQQNRKSELRHAIAFESIRFDSIWQNALNNLPSKSN